jgi:hypothetical protein
MDIRFVKRKKAKNVKKGSGVVFLAFYTLYACPERSRRAERFTLEKKRVIHSSPCVAGYEGR